MDTSTSTVTSSTIKNDEDIINSLADDIRDLENQILPQFDELGKKIPELYKGYADLVRTFTSEALRAVPMSSRNTAKINMAAEIAARGIQAYGAIKNAQKHNEQLDKFLKLKQTIAQANMKRNDKALAAAKVKLETLSKLLNKYATTTLKIEGIAKELLLRQASVNLRILDMYRTNFFLVSLSEYIGFEYIAWLEGAQTSGEIRPDYYMINRRIFGELFSEKPFKELEYCCDKRGNLTGAEIMLLSDYQLSMFALKDNVCAISINEASLEVKALISNNQAFTDYENVLSPFVKHVKEIPGNELTIAFIATLLIVIALCIFYIPGSWGIRLVIIFSTAMASFKIYNKNMFKLQSIFCQEAEEIGEKVERFIESGCGKIEQSEMDYEKKDILSAGIKGFFNV